MIPPFLHRNPNDAPLGHPKNECVWKKVSIFFLLDLVHAMIGEWGHFFQKTHFLIHPAKIEHRRDISLRHNHRADAALRRFDLSHKYHKQEHEDCTDHECDQVGHHFLASIGKCRRHAYVILIPDYCTGGSSLKSLLAYLNLCLHHGPNRLSPTLSHNTQNPKFENICLLEIFILLYHNYLL